MWKARERRYMYAAVWYENLKEREGMKNLTLHGV
jgi:hypothetical protein